MTIPSSTCAGSNTPLAAAFPFPPPNRLGAVIAFVVPTGVTFACIAYWATVGTFSWQGWLAAMLAYAVCNATIGVVHRVYSHDAAQIAPRWQGLHDRVLAVLSAFAMQGKITYWVSLHKIHHATADTPTDPYGVRRFVATPGHGLTGKLNRLLVAALNFLWAHKLWMAYYNLAENGRAMIRHSVTLLKRHPALAWQEQHYWKMLWATNLALPLLLGLLLSTTFWGVVGGEQPLTSAAVHTIVVDDMVETLLAVALGRWLQHEATGLVNSANHTWGRKNYGKADASARHNRLVNLLVGGEGQHDLHHANPTDWRGNIGGFDPNGWVIWLLWRLGVYTQLKATPAERLAALKTG